MQACLWHSVLSVLLVFEVGKDSCILQIRKKRGQAPEEVVYSDLVVPKFYLCYISLNYSDNSIVLTVLNCANLILRIL